MSHKHYIELQFDRDIEGLKPENIDIGDLKAGALTSVDTGKYRLEITNVIDHYETIDVKIKNVSLTVTPDSLKCDIECDTDISIAIDQSVEVEVNKPIDSTKCITSFTLINSDPDVKWCNKNKDISSWFDDQKTGVLEGITMTSGVISSNGKTLSCVFGGTPKIKGQCRMKMRVPVGNISKIKFDVESIDNPTDWFSVGASPQDVEVKKCIVIPGDDINDALMEWVLEKEINAIGKEDLLADDLELETWEHVGEAIYHVKCKNAKNVSKTTSRIHRPEYNFHPNKFDIKFGEVKITMDAVVITGSTGTPLALPSGAIGLNLTSRFPNVLFSVPAGEDVTKWFNAPAGVKCTAHSLDSARKKLLIDVTGTPTGTEEAAITMNIPEGYIDDVADTFTMPTDPKCAWNIAAGAFDVHLPDNQGVTGVIGKPLTHDGDENRTALLIYAAPDEVEWQNVASWQDISSWFNLPKGLVAHADDIWNSKVLPVVFDGTPTEEARKTIIATVPKGVLSFCDVAKTTVENPKTTYNISANKNVAFEDVSLIQE